MPTVPYYSDWRERTWTCECGWTGTGKAASHEAFRELLQVDCPSCDRRICLVPYPDEAETRAAAKAGNEEAKRERATERRIAAWDKRRDRSLLRDPGVLPPLDGVDRIALTFLNDERLGEDEDSRMVLLANGEEIFWEIAAWETTEPLERILGHAIARYGDRIVSVDTSPATLYLCGDRISSLGEVDRILAEYGFDEEGNR